MVQIDWGPPGEDARSAASRKSRSRSNMIRANLLIGKPVVANTTGRQLEVIKDLVFDHENNRLLGFLTNRGGWTGSARLLPWSAVLTVGLRAVIARGANLIVDAHSIPRVREVLEKGDSVLGKTVETVHKTPVGTLSDVFFDKATGVIKGYEILDGAHTDKNTSRLFLPAPLTLTITNGGVEISRKITELIEQSRLRPARQPDLR